MRFPPNARGGACRLLLLVALVITLFPRQIANAAEPSNVVEVTAELETTPVIGSGDAADDPAVWVDPVDPSRSLIFGNDKDGRALEIYDLNGTRIGRVTDDGGFFGNVDVRRNFPLAGGLVDIVAVTLRSNVRIYKIDPATRTLSNITDGGTISTGAGAEGLCLHHSARTGQFSVLTIARSGDVRHIELRDADNDGLIDGVVRRSWAIGAEAEGCVFDDELGHLYIAEEDRGIWKYGAELTDPVGTGSRTSVDVIGSGGNLVSDVEGLAIVHQPGGTGYLLASAQNVATPTRSYFTVYRREGNNAYVDAFRVANGPNTDACSRTDGIEAVAVPLGPRFPHGVFICQDDANTTPGNSGNQNFKLVRLERAVDLGDVPPPPPPPPSGEISVVGSTSNSSPNARTGITINRPAGTAAGDFLVASIGIVDDDPMYQAPSGWARIRAESINNRLRVETFVKVAGGSEPSAYTWTLPDWRRIAGGITAYRGVDGTSPVDAHAAAVHPSNGTAVTAPSVTTSVPGAMLVHVAVVNAEAAVSPPAGMTEAWEATGWRAGDSRDVTISSSHVRQPASGATGQQTAQSSVAGHRIGALLALRPAAGSGGDTTPPDTAITSGPSGTVASDSATFTFSSTEAGSTFACRLDAGAPEPCTSPQSYTGLADGEHTFAVAATDPAGNTDPTPDSRTWIVDPGEPPPPPDGEITVVGSASNSSPDARTSITIGRPAGTSAGDVLVAAIAIVDDDPSYQAPAGWSRVRSDMIHDGLRVEVFAKTAGNSEPATYTWTLPDWRRIAGGITSFRGVDGTAPVDAHGALAVSAAGTAVTAPSITTSAGSMLVHVAVINAEAALDPPGGMDEAWEATGWRAGSPRDVTVSSSFAPQPTSGATGERTATASAAGARIGVLLALRPGVPPGPDTTPPETTITSGPSGTVDSDSATFTFTSSEAGSTFVCQLDAEDAEPCTSPGTYTGLADGEHTFSVRATDPAGNTDPTSAARAWTVDTSVPSGLISTIAGTGVRSSGGDGGPATSAGLSAPRTMASDAAGNLYIADTENHRVRRVGTDGVITTIAGTGAAGYSGDGGPATAARLNNPHGVAVDAAGNVFVADSPNQRVRRVGTDGVITTVAGTGTSGYNGDGIPATAARLNYPKGVEVGPDGALYIGDANNHRVRRVASDGIITTIAGTGVSGFSGDGGPATSARLNTPRNVAFDPAGNLFIADDRNHRVRRVALDGIITTVAGNGTAGYGGDGGPATEARLGRVRDVAVDNAGNVYIADPENHRVRRVDPAGVITTVAGTGAGGFSGDGGPAEAARVAGPRGVAVDPHGRLLIADTGNHRIRRVS